MPAAPDLVTAVLLAALVLVLGEILRAVSTGELFVPQQPRRRLEFDWAVLAAALVFILLNIVPVLLQPLFAGGESAGEKPASPSLRIEAAILTNFVVIAVLISLIIARRKNRLTDYGIDLHGWLAEMRFGGLGFLVSLPFVIGIILITTRWRGPDTQNPLLVLLHQTGSGRTILEVAFTAVISAPLAEELLFRIAFQGPLETRLPRGWAIAIPAFVFASVHGPYDALPLLPLALVLGALYHLRRSYVAVVTAHGLFNAAFLVLALFQR
jgi:membrane protease YdiL (CAAX protease family)